MSKTLTVEGDMGTVDARVQLTTQGSVTAPSLVVPSGVTKIDKIIVAAATEGLADGASIFFVRIGGNAVDRGEQTIIISAAGRIAPQAGSDSAPQICKTFVLSDCQIMVNPSDTIAISAEMAGVDTGTAHAVATIIFA
jgi:hypothetical protein